MSVTCTPDNLAELAKCFTDLSQGQLQAIQAYLLCQVANSGGGKSLSVQVDTFTTVGANTWTKPTGFVCGYRIGIGGGGGGGSGRKGAAGAQRIGGQSGSPGGVNESWFTASDVGATETVTIGAGGTGGASQTTNSTNGNAGSDGGDTTMTGTGSTFKCNKGYGGNGGTLTTITARISPVSCRPITVPGTSSPNSTTLPSAPNFCGIGGNGIGITNGDAYGTYSVITGQSTTGGNGLGFAGPNAGGACGTTDGQSGSNGTDSPVAGAWGGGGGGSGYASLTGNAGAGGNGGKYGASGGGGGVAVDSVGNSGAGGNGAQGIMVVISYVQS